MPTTTDPNLSSPEAPQNGAVSPAEREGEESVVPDVENAPGASQDPQDGTTGQRRKGHEICPQCGAPLRDGRPCGFHFPHRDPVVLDAPDPNAKPIGRQVGEYLLHMLDMMPEEKPE